MVCLTCSKIPQSGIRQIHRGPDFRTVWTS